MEELEKPETQEAFRDGQEYDARNLYQRVAGPQPSGQEAHREARERPGESLHPQEAATRRVLEESGRESDEAARLGPAAKRDERGQDEGQVRGDAAHAPRRHEARLNEAAAESHEQKG